MRQPGSGFFPTLVSLALILSAAVAAVRAQRGAQALEVHGHKRLWIVVGSIAAYAWAITTVGFLVCTMALLVLLLRGMGHVRWSVSLACAVAASLGCYALFTRLGVPLPAGVLGF